MGAGRVRRGGGGLAGRPGPVAAPLAPLALTTVRGRAGCKRVCKPAPTARQVSLAVLDE